MSIEAIVNEFSAVAANPKGQLKAYKDAGKKCIGVMPYYAPEELVYAAGMMPFGMWGSNNKTEQRSKEYCATFYCTIAQLDLEMLLDGTMDLLDGVITPTICDTLRPMSQNIRVAMSEKLPCIFLAHPQNRFWPMMAALTGEPVPAREDIEAKKGIILRHGLALWDTLESCTITGASDASIRDVVPNDCLLYTSDAADE